MMRHSPETHFLLLRHTDQLAPKVDGQLLPVTVNI